MSDKPIMDFISKEVNGMRAVQKQGMWGFIDIDNNVVVPIQYSVVSPFDCNGCAAVCKNALWGYVGKEGEIKVPIEYDLILAFSCDLAAVMKNGKWGFVDTNGNVVVPLEYDEVDKFIEGIARVRKGALWGYILNNGKLLTDYRYAEAYNNTCGNLVVNEGGQRDKKWGVVSGGKWFVLSSKTGTPLTDKMYDNLSCYIDGYAKASIGCFTENDCFVGGRWGYIDKNGIECIPVIYDEVSNVSEGYVKVRKGFRFGLVDMKGNVIIPIEFEFISPVNYGAGFVICDGKKYPLNKGKVVD